MSDLLQGIAAIIVAIGGVYGAMRGFRAKKQENQAAERERAAAAIEQKAAERKAAEQAAATQAAQTRQDDRDQLQEDLKNLREEMRTLRADYERRDRYQTAYSRHLENEIGALRAAWPPGISLPDRPPPPRWDQIV